VEPPKQAALLYWPPVIDGSVLHVQITTVVYVFQQL